MLTTIKQIRESDMSEQEKIERVFILVKTGVLTLPDSLVWPVSGVTIHAALCENLRLTRQLLNSEGRFPRGIPTRAQLRKERTKHVQIAIQFAKLIGHETYLIKILKNENKH